jgi:predicted nucleic acid-binding protein
MIVLDTNVLSELMKSNGSPTVYEWVGKQAHLPRFSLKLLLNEDKSEDQFHNLMLKLLSFATLEMPSLQREM